jgi:hypothetical protein
MPPALAGSKRKGHFVEHDSHVVVSLEKDPQAERKVHALPAIPVGYILNQQIKRCWIRVKAPFQITQP